MLRKSVKPLVAVISVIILMLSLSLCSGAAKYKVGTVSELEATQTTNTITLSWKKAKNASGYKIMEKKDGKWKTMAVTTSTACILTELSPSTKHTYAVKAFNDKKQDYVQWSKKSKKITALTKPRKASKLSTTSVTETSVSLSWKKAKGASGYEIYKYDVIAKGWVALKKTTSQEMTVNNLSPGTDYTFAVRSYYKKSKQTVYSDIYTQINITTKAIPEPVAEPKPVQLLVNSTAYGGGVIYVQVESSNWDGKLKSGNGSANITIINNGSSQDIPCKAKLSKSGYSYEIKIDISGINIPSGSTVNFTIPAGLIKNQDETQFNLKYSSSVIIE